MMQLSIAQFADKIGEIMPVVMKEFTRRVIMDFESRVTMSQVLILELLEKRQESKMKDIASFMGVSTAAATGIADRLVKCGYVVRVFDPDDRRIIRIRLTPKGHGLIKQFDSQRRRLVMRIFSRISEKDRQDYLRILGLIKDVLINSEPRE